MLDKNLGLEFLHSRGIAHRDIKLENLLLDTELNLIIADFGCAARYHTEDNKITDFDSATIVGSQEYNAPEINMDKCYHGDKADVFSCAVCLFMMMVGNSPFRMASKCDPYFKLLAKKDKSSYWSIYSAAPLSPEFKDLFEKMTERNPEKRLALAEVRSHPWMKGKMLDSVELVEEMKDRLQLFENIYRRELNEYKKQMEECKRKHEWEINQKSSQDICKDPLIQGFMLECQEINAYLEKQKAVEVLGENLSDDQINSNIKNNLDEENVSETKEDEIRINTKSINESVHDIDKR